ncbi:acyl carrier protein [Pseudomonas sp. NFXW11]|uniref:acyl carrier protein n=1 Tax=Pseudomonas sp. NFXW11 TaxID=2819531 RepID=UPI003CEBE50A
MTRADARLVLYPLIRRRLEAGVEFDDSSQLQALGLELDDIEALLWQLEDRFDLPTSTRATNPALEQLQRVADLIEWLQAKSWQNR